MHNEFQQAFFPERKSPRLKNYDYGTQNYYFVTICTHDKSCIFGKPDHLNEFGLIAQTMLLDIPKHFPSVFIDKWVVMPNHIHAIIAFEKGETTLPTVIGLYKSSVSKEIHKRLSGIKVWHSSFHDHIIRNQRDYERIWTYIDNNPSAWNLDCYFI